MLQHHRGSLGYTYGTQIQIKSSHKLLIKIKVHPEKMRQALTMDMLATDLADYLVRKGVSSGHTDVSI